MKINVFNRPHVGVKTGLDPVAAVAGVIALASVALSYPWFFIGG